MKLTVYFTPLGVTQSAVAGKPILVVDLLRTTTTMVAALANGARAICPAATADEALRVAQNLERDSVVLAGERRMERIEGFDLGNSPLEMTPEQVRGKTLVMATTNGTGTIVSAEPGRPVLVAAAVNFGAVVERARRAADGADELIILCSGREKMFALEDAYAAGRFAQALMAGRDRRATELNDGAIAALELVRRYGENWRRAISSSAAARALMAVGYKDDVVAATEADKYPIVPEYGQRLVTVPAEA
jgi:2-phosphosulfolactate phosphatase